MQTRGHLLTSVADQCMYGLVTLAPLPDKRPMAAKKPTRFITSSARIGEEFKRTCNHLHNHQRLMGSNRAKKSARYPEELCRAACKGYL